MDSSDEDDLGFNSSADLFENPEVVLVAHDDDKTPDSQLFSEDGKEQRTYSNKQLQKSSGKVIQNTMVITQVETSSSQRSVSLMEEVTPGSSGAERYKNGHSSLISREEINNEIDEITKEDFVEGRPSKRYRKSESKNSGETPDDIDGNLVAENKNDGVSLARYGTYAAHATADRYTSGCVRVLDLVTSQDDASSVEKSLHKNNDLTNDVEMVAIDSNLKNGLDHMSSYPEKTSPGFTSDVKVHNDMCNLSMQPTCISQNQSSVSTTSSVLTCPFCNIQLNNLNLMEIHLESMHSELSKYDNGEVTMLDYEGDHFINHESDALQFVCPFCNHDLGDRMTLDLHLLSVHDEEHSEKATHLESCPLCGMTSHSESEMKLHIKSHATDQIVYGISQDEQGAVFSAPADPPVMTCPVCTLEMTDADLLNSHIESHFNPKHRSEPDVFVVDKQGKENIEVQGSGNAQKDLRSNLEEIQTPPSGNRSDAPSTSKDKLTPSNSKDSLSYRRQFEQNLDKAMTRGKMSPADYHKQKLLMVETEMQGVDSGSTRTQGLTEKIQYLFRTQAYPGQAVHLCSATDHYSGSFGDRGWGCGYRNFQMMLSCLSRYPDFAQKIFSGGSVSMPSIPKIQQMIESAWKMGFDPEGCRQLRGQLVNTRKWIGATEIVAVLSSLGIKCHLADFHAPSAPDGTHPRLLQWVSDYFRTHQPGLVPPLYLQHQGHSCTIIGVERDRGTTKLLLFDPGTPKDVMTSLAKGQLNWKHMRTFRRTQAGLRAKQYQIVAVLGFLTDAEYQESKHLKSEQVS